MIRLKNIKREGNEITCDAYVEDCAQAIPFVYHIDTEENDPVVYPEGYEDCTSHIGHARWFFQETLEKGEELPQQRTIMWY